MNTGGKTNLFTGFWIITEQYRSLGDPRFAQLFCVYYSRYEAGLVDRGHELRLISSSTSGHREEIRWLPARATERGRRSPTNTEMAAWLSRSTVDTDSLGVPKTLRHDVEETMKPPPVRPIALDISCSPRYSNVRFQGRSFSTKCGPSLFGLSTTFSRGRFHYGKPVPH